MLGPLRDRISSITSFLFWFTKTWSIWFMMLWSGDLQVSLCICLCWNCVLMIIILLAAAKSHRSSPFLLISSCNVCLPVIFWYAGSFPSFACVVVLTVNPSVYVELVTFCISEWLAALSFVISFSFVVSFDQAVQTVTQVCCEVQQHYIVQCCFRT